MFVVSVCCEHKCVLLMCVFGLSVCFRYCVRVSVCVCICVLRKYVCFVPCVFM